MKHDKYLNYQGEDFWPDHFRDFKVLRFFISAFIDFLKEKMHSPELSIFIAGIYMLGLNVRLMGIYSTYALCQPFLSVDFEVPTFLMIENSFSKYISHFYFLCFIGNLKNTNFVITSLCAFFGFYQFALMFVDVICIQLMFCIENNRMFIEYNGLFVYAYCKCIVAFIIAVHWLVILISPTSVGHIQILPCLGACVRTLFLKSCKFKFLKNIYENIKRPFDYPLRIKAAATIAFGICFAVNLTVLLYCYKVYEIIDTVHRYKRYLDTKPANYLFILIDVENPLAMYADQGKDLLDFIIYLLTPIFGSLVAGFVFGLVVVLISVLNMLYYYRKIIFTIRDEGSSSKLLEKVWEFRAHSSIFFCAQFVLNSFFLNFIVAFCVFIACYIISFQETYIYGWLYIKSRPAEFWIGLTPVLLGALYFPRLINKDNFIRNYSYFSFWDSWYFLIGTIGAFLKAAVRYLIGFGTTVLLGYMVQKSIMPSPLKKMDTLYVGFYSTILVQCLKEKIIPEKLKQDLNFTEPMLASIN